LSYITLTVNIEKKKQRKAKKNKNNKIFPLRLSAHYELYLMYLIQFRGDSYSFVKEFDYLIDKAYPVEASRFRYFNFSMCCFIPFCCSV